MAEVIAVRQKKEKIKTDEVRPLRSREMTECFLHVRQAEKRVLFLEFRMGLMLACFSFVLGAILWLCIAMFRGGAAGWILGISLTFLLSLLTTKSMLQAYMRDSRQARREAYLALKRSCEDSPDRARALLIRYAASGHINEDGKVVMLKQAADYLARNLPSGASEEMLAYLNSCSYGLFSAYRILADPESVASICLGKRIETDAHKEKKNIIQRI